MEIDSKPLAQVVLNLAESIKNLFLYNQTTKPEEHLKKLTKEEIFNLLPMSHIDKMADKRLLIVRWFVAFMLFDMLVISNLHSLGRRLSSLQINHSDGQG